MDDNVTVIAGASIVAAGLAYAGSQLTFTSAPPPEKKVVYVTAGTKAEEIGSRRKGDLFPDHRYWLFCERQWKDDWRMRDHCERSQDSAKSWASSRVIDEDIAHQCTRQWSDDWHMFKHCVNSQTSAKEKVTSRR